MYNRLLVSFSFVSIFNVSRKFECCEFYKLWGFAVILDDKNMVFG